LRGGAARHRNAAKASGQIACRQIGVESHEMRILVTGSSGWLGQTLVPRLRRDGHDVVGIDPIPSENTQVVGSIVDRQLVKATMRDFEVRAVIHCGGLHKPDIETRQHSDFIAVNVQGTLNLLEESVLPGSKVDRFIFTSTTSLMISRDIRAGLAGGRSKAAWITEEMAALAPRNIYGVSKLAAEQLCRLFHELHGLPVLILRTSRFFPEADDMAHAIAQSDLNTKVNEFLFRRLTVEDAAESHVEALKRAPELGFDTFIISALTPFSPDDCQELIRDAPSVVKRYFPQYPLLYARMGWTMFQSIDRVYVSDKARRRLGFACRSGFSEKLKELERQLAAQA
jgi:UDP-glucose 4-epimerase